MIIRNFFYWLFEPVGPWYLSNYRRSTTEVRRSTWYGSITVWRNKFTYHYDTISPSSLNLEPLVQLEYFQVKHYYKLYFGKNFESIVPFEITRNGCVYSQRTGNIHVLTITERQSIQILYSKPELKRGKLENSWL